MAVSFISGDTTFAFVLASCRFSSVEASRFLMHA